MKAALLISVMGALASAQSGGLFELRGVVFEVGPNTPLAGARVTVYQFDQELTRTVFDSVVTDSSGAFQFHVVRAGDYYVEAAKPEYFAAGTLAVFNAPTQTTTGTIVTLNSGHPSADLRFALLRFGDLSGNVVDEDAKPVSGLIVDLIPGPLGLAPGLASNVLRSTRTAKTMKDGSFHATGLAPGKYAVRVSTGTILVRPTPDFSAEDESVVDQEFESVYWPGVPDQASASIVTVNPGGATYIGSLRIRKEPRARVHLRPVGCEPEEQLNVAILDSERGNLTDALGLIAPWDQAALPCKDLLVRGLRAGSYRVIAETKRSATEVPLTIAGRNLTVPLTLIPNGDVSGRIVTAPDVPAPARQPTLRIRGSAPIRPDEKGNFSIANVECIPNVLQPAQLDKGYYIKELRVNGIAVSGSEIPLCAGSRLEVVLDNKVATLNLSITDGDKPASDPMIAVRKWPESRLDRQRPEPQADKLGHAQVTDLAPGDYQVLAVRQVTLPDGDAMGAVTSQLWDKATKVTLGPGDTKSISVKMIDPFQ